MARLINSLLLVAGLAVGHDGVAAVALPSPILKGEHSLEETLAQRRSVRQYANRPLSLEDVSQLLWAAQGITNRKGYRTAPSAGALYPLDIYVAVGEVDGLEPGVYRYHPRSHSLEQTFGKDVRAALAVAAYLQPWVGSGRAVFVISVRYGRTGRKYGQRGTRYVHIEAGHAAQNLFLQAVARGLATVTVGAFTDSAVAKVLGLDGDEQPLLINPAPI